MASAMSSHCPLFGPSSFGTGGSTYTTQGENKSENVLFHFAFPRGPFMVYFVASSRHRNTKFVLR